MLRLERDATRERVLVFEVVDSSQQSMGLLTTAVTQPLDSHSYSISAYRRSVGLQWRNKLDYLLCSCLSQFIPATPIGPLTKPQKSEPFSRSARCANLDKKMPRRMAVAEYCARETDLNMLAHGRIFLLVLMFPLLPLSFKNTLVVILSEPPQES